MGGVQGATVVDLFCGSGALGAEALSRGAAEATFVDHDTAALEAVRANLAAAGLGDRRVTVVRAELPGWLSRCAPVDVALCDPPYAFGDWATLLGALRADVAVLESASEIELPEGWALHRARRYGGTLVTVARTTPAAPAATPADRTAAAAIVS
jgi:16S rRNA (guanine966-N2)-methyltransferase